jgi:uncharacterized membrane protein
MKPSDDTRLEIAMGYMLRIGVTIAALVVFLGTVLYVKQFDRSKPDFGHFHGAPSDSKNLHAIFNGVAHLDGQSVIAFGLLLLVATPTCRVIFGLVGFALEGDRLYTAVSAAVLTILMFSLIGGR